MNGLLATGIGLTVAGLAGYAIGIGTAYPGRAFSVTAIMAGITLIGIHRVEGGPDA